MSVSTTPLTDPTSLPGIDYADSGALYPDWRGINYNPTVTVKEVAATVRKEIRKAVKAGALGSATAASVRYESGTLSSSILIALTVPKVRVDAATPTAIEAIDSYGDPVWMIETERGRDRVEPGAREAMTKAQRFHESFNRSGSNTQIDYFDERFYGRVTVSDENGGWTS